MKKQKFELMTKLILTKNFFDFFWSRLIDCKFDDLMQNVLFDAFCWFGIFFWLISLKLFCLITSILFWLIWFESFEIDFFLSSNLNLIR